MKNIIFLILVLVFSFYYFYTKNNNTNINQVKQEILGTNILSGETSSGKLDEAITLDDISDEKPSFTITQISKGNPLIKIDDLTGKDLTSGEVEITGIALSNVDKIDVYFINKDSIYPEDLYVLNKFKSGTGSFKYLASSNFKTLDFGLNEYTFTAYSSGNIYKVKIEINLPKNQEKSLSGDISTSQKENLNENDISSFNMPNLTIKKDFVQNIKCENLTEYLTQNYNYPYWNKCRDITKDKSIGFYVLRLDGDNYYYEKHYINYEKSIYGILILESGSGITKDQLSDKNNELKLKNWDETLKVDELFK